MLMLKLKFVPVVKKVNQINDRTITPYSARVGNVKNVIKLLDILEGQIFVKDVKTPFYKELNESPLA